MSKKNIIIDNYCLGYWDDSIIPEEAIICLEQLMFSPDGMLVRKYKIKSKVEYMSFILPHIAKLFKVNRDKLRNQWIDGEGFYECFGERVCLEKCLKEKNSDRSL